MGSFGIGIVEILLGLALLVFGFIEAMQLLPQLAVYGAGLVLIVLGLRTLVRSRRAGKPDVVETQG